jgi:putative peptidoglycan lipid II flippase
MAGLRVLVLTTVDVVVFILLARLMRVGEVTEVLDTVLRRRRGAHAS